MVFYCDFIASSLFWLLCKLLFSLIFSSCQAHRFWSFRLLYCKKKSAQFHVQKYYQDAFKFILWLLSILANSEELTRNKRCFQLFRTLLSVGVIQVIWFDLIWYQIACKYKSTLIIKWRRARRRKTVLIIHSQSERKKERKKIFVNKSTNQKETFKWAVNEIPAHCIVLCAVCTLQWPCIGIYYKNRTNLTVSTCIFFSSILFPFTLATTVFLFLNRIHNHRLVVWGQ